MRTPMIGITTETSANNEYTVPVEYVAAVQRAGGVALLIPPGQTNLDALLRVLDGLILSGGGDIDPVHYASPGHPAVYMIDGPRDALELELAQLAVAAELPTLGVCRGAQLINVAFGGTLVEHLPDEIDNTIAHRREPQGAVQHAVNIAPGSRLAAILGSGEMVVASWHHQAIRTPAPVLHVTATAADGTVEAVEHPGHTWMLAVQWHPEMTAAKDPTQQQLFHALVAAAQQYHEARSART